MKEFIKTKEFYFLTFFYTITHSLILLNYDGVYWDDWVFYNQSFETIYKLFHQSGHGLPSTIGIIISRFGNEVMSFRLFIFMTGFFNGILIYFILKNLKLIDKSLIFFITIFYFVSPLFAQKNEMTIYPMSTFSFFLAFYLLSEKLFEKNFKYRISINLLFFFSFYTNSYLVYFLIPLLYLFFVDLRDNKNKIFKTIFQFFKTYPDLILLPVLFFIYKSIFLKPYGLYQGYNLLTLRSFIDSFSLFKIGFDLSFFYPIEESYSLVKNYVIILVVISLLFGFFLERKIKSNFKNPFLLLLLGIFLFALGMFPYLVVNKIPTSMNTDCRHQLLLPLGFSFLIVFSITTLGRFIGLKSKIINSIFYFLAIIFSINTIETSFRFIVDNFYQQSVMENIRINKIFKENDTFVVENKLLGAYVYNRPITYYEYNGYLKLIFKDDSRFMLEKNYAGAINYIEIVEKDVVPYRSQKHYNYSNWKNEKQPILVFITKGEELTTMLKLRLFFNYLKNREKFNLLVRNLTTLSVVKYQGKWVNNKIY